MRNKGMIIILFLMSLIALSYTTVPVEVFIEPDPPSVYNMAGGGLSRYYYDNALRSEVISELSDITRKNPVEYVLIIPGSGKILIPPLDLLKWVERGGVVIVMDESLHTTPLLNKLGLTMDQPLSSIDTAICNIDGKVTNITLNVYAILKTAENNRDKATPICFINDKVVAWRIRYGDGVFYIIGDSSIVINEMITHRRIVSENSMFLSILVQDRKMVFYDSFTRRETTTLERLLGVLSWLVHVVTHATEIVREQDLLIRTTIYVAISVIPTSLLFIMIGEMEFPLKNGKELLKLEEVLNQVKQKLSKYCGERSA